MRRNNHITRNAAAKGKKGTGYFVAIPRPALSFEEYLDFVTAVNEFSNHAPKPFKRIEGKHFKL